MTVSTPMSCAVGRMQRRKMTTTTDCEAAAAPTLFVGVLLRAKVEPAAWGLISEFLRNLRSTLHVKVRLEAQENSYKLTKRPALLPSTYFVFLVAH